VKKPRQLCLIVREEEGGKVRLLSLGLILSTLLSSLSYAEPYALEENNFDLENQPIQWEPIKKQVTTPLIDLELWILHQTVPAPMPGYLLKKNDWIEIRRVLNDYGSEVKRIKTEERRVCDSLLKEKDESCARQNKDLIEKIEDQDRVIVIKDSKIKDLHSDLFWTKTLSGTSVGLLLSLLVYQAVK